jgi:hypothetical protein|uniref:Uncharacterized protein n=1 Tax=viral metagenome TaxID=1070528 RepID=A0A6C0IMF2_9ZZZZ
MIVLRDFIIGGCVAGIFSYITNQYDHHPEYLKIAAYLWGMPSIFFLLLYMSFKKGNAAALDVCRHCLLGVGLSFITIALTIVLFDLGRFNLIYLNLLTLFALIFTYMFFKIYEH